jgi:hypothetical protein
MYAKGDQRKMRNLKYAAIAVAISFFAALNGCGDKGGKLESIMVTPAEIMMVKGSTQQFKATAIFSDGTTVNWSAAATWSTSNSSVVSISNDLNSYGLATAPATAATGTVTITATDVPNNISGSAVFYVVDPVSITIRPLNPHMAAGTNYQFKAKALLPNNTVQDLASNITWTTTDNTIATVNNTGLVTALTATNSTTIEVTYSSPGSKITGTTLLTVNAAALDTLEISGPASISVGNTVQFTATGTLTDSSTISIMPSSLNWTSSNTAVASFGTTLESEWILKADGTGKTNITATDPITGIPSKIFELTVQ